MTYGDVYEMCRAVIGEEEGEDEIRDRAVKIMGTACLELWEMNEAYRAAKGEWEAGTWTMPGGMEEKFPLETRFAGAAAYRTAGEIECAENAEMAKMAEERYGEEVKQIAKEIAASIGQIKEVY